jgi:CubicO group peptidase (beta-lactamase class C family)
MTSKIYFLIILFLVFGCKENSKKETQYIPKVKYAMLPSKEQLPKLSASYVSMEKKQIESFFNTNFKTDFQNISFLVAKNGQIIYEKYEGFADKENNILNSADTPLHIASVTKVLTASAILKLIDSGKITLDQKLTTLFKGFPYPNITIRNLLNHRSGLKKYNYFTEDKQYWDTNKTLTNQDILTILITKKLPLDYPTDTHFVYNNTNYALLALIIEKVTGMKYPEAMKEIIFEPLGMHNTFVFDANNPNKKATPSYKWNYEKYKFDYLDAIYGDKNIYSTPRDLLKFDMARNAPNFLSKSLLEQVYKGYSYENKGVKNYGLGIRLREWPTGQKLFYHNGWWHGNTSAYIPIKEENAVIIALSNKFTSKTYQVKRLAILFGDFPFSLNDSTAEDGSASEPIINDSIVKK